jgi:hypothetical protein
VARRCIGDGRWVNHHPDSPYGKPTDAASTSNDKVGEYFTVYGELSPEEIKVGLTEVCDTSPYAW